MELYSWHAISFRVPKILNHGSVKIQHALLPIRTLLEETAEQRNIILDSEEVFSVPYNTDVHIKIGLTFGLSNRKKYNQPGEVTQQMINDEEGLRLFHLLTVLNSIVLNFVLS